VTLLLFVGLTVVAAAAADAGPAAAGVGRTVQTSTTLAPSRFVALASPVRAYDSGAGGVGTSPVRVTLGATIPADATAVVLNLTGDRPSKATTVTAYPGNLSTPPTVSALNLTAGSTDADLVTVALPGAAGGTIDLHSSTGTVRLIVDLAGYYTASTTAGGAVYVPAAPFRAYDSRTVDGGGAPLTGTAQTLSAAALHVPASATAVVANVTAVAPSTSTFLTVWPAGRSKPTVSDLNVAGGDTRANLVTVGLGAAGAGISLANAIGSTQFLVDVVGWYSSSATGALYTPLVTPTRVFGVSARPALGAGKTFDLALPAPVPADASAAAFTLTVAAASAKTHLDAYAPGPLPATSNVNVDAGVNTPNLVLSSLGSSTTAVEANASSLTGSVHTATAVRFANSVGTAELIVDLQGYFVPNPGGNDVAYTQCSSSGTGSGTAEPLPTSAAFGILNPTGGGLAFSGVNPCLGAEDSWATGTPGGEGFYLALSDKGPSSANWPGTTSTPQACTAGANSAGCAYDFGYDQAQNVYADAATTGHATAATWWLDVETSAPWQASTSQNAQVVDGAQAYLAAEGVTVGLYSTASQWSALVAALGIPSAPEWYAQAGLSDAQLVTYCTASFAGGAVSLVQDGGSADGTVLDSDLHC
jgi:hypothetical protein